MEYDQCNLSRRSRYAVAGMEVQISEDLMVEETWFFAACSVGLWRLSENDYVASEKLFWSLISNWARERANGFCFDRQ